MKTRDILIGLAVLVFVISLMIFGKMTGTTVSGVWKNTDIRCLSQGEQSIVQHSHSKLEIYEDGVQVPVPSNIGVSGMCLSELHTHEAGGVIHVESASSSRVFTLQQFFDVWGEPFKRDGKMPIVLVNDEPVSIGSVVELRDGLRIRIEYGEIDSVNTKTQTEDLDLKKRVQ